MMSPQCSECGLELPKDGVGHYRKATGWVKIRPRGANELALREDSDEWMCRDCMGQAKAGLTPNHPSLFE